MIDSCQLLVNTVNHDCLDHHHDHHNKQVYEKRGASVIAHWLAVLVALVRLCHVRVI
jgi:hypothetical protein